MTTTQGELDPDELNALLNVQVWRRKKTIRWSIEELDRGKMHDHGSNEVDVPGKTRPWLARHVPIAHTRVLTFARDEHSQACSC